MALSQNTTWELSLEKFQQTQKAVWHRHVRYMSCPLFAAGRDFYYVGESRTSWKINKDGYISGGYWVSPSLNNNQEEELTIKALFLRFQAPSITTFGIQASGDGGVNWVNGNRGAGFAVPATTTGIKRISDFFNVTGYDVRFRLNFPAALLHGFEWEARVVVRGNLKRES